MTLAYQPRTALTPAHHLLSQLERIRLGIERRQLAASDCIPDAERVLESLPLSTGEFALARQRLCNVSGYLKQMEWGAASYEVQLVLRWLRAFLERSSVEPIRNRRASRRNP